MGPTTGNINGADHHADAKALPSDLSKMNINCQPCFKQRALSVGIALWCLQGLCDATSGGAHAQNPVDVPGKIVVPTLSNQSQQRTTKDETIAQDLSYWVVGTDAVVGLVSPDQTPGDSSSMSALLANTSLGTTNNSAQLVLVDGQRIPGKLENRQGVATWVSLWCAPRVLVTDEIRSLVFGRVTPPPAVDTDVIQLKNGDRVTGFISAINPTTVTIDVGSGTTTTLTVAMETITALSLAGPNKPHTGARVWLTDGTVLDGPSVSWMSPSYLRIMGIAGAKTPVVTVPRDRVLAVQSAPDSATPLATLTPVASIPQGCDGFRFTTSIPLVAPGTWALDAPPLELDGPVLLTYPAPAVNTRLVAVAYRTPTARLAGSVDVVIRSGGKELLRERFESNRARVEIRVDLPVAPFEIELQPADGNAVGDTVTFERAVLFPR
jgi:hypothetical protein